MSPREDRRGSPRNADASLVKLLETSAEVRTFAGQAIVYFLKHIIICKI